LFITTCVDNTAPGAYLQFVMHHSVI